VRCIVLTGGDTVFAAGADLRDMADRGAVEIMLRNTHTLRQTIAACPKPVIAAVSGLAWGGGCELAMHADIIVAGRSASFCQPEVKVGIMEGCRSPRSTTAPASSPSNASPRRTTSTAPSPSASATRKARWPSATPSAPAPCWRSSAPSPFLLPAVRHEQQGLPILVDHKGFDARTEQIAQNAPDPRFQNSPHFSPRASDHS